MISTPISQIPQMPQQQTIPDTDQAIQEVLAEVRQSIPAPEQQQQYASSPQQYAAAGGYMSPPPLDIDDAKRAVVAAIIFFILAHPRVLSLLASKIPGGRDGVAVLVVSALIFAALAFVAFRFL
jgi:hypothetical protein